MIKKLLLTLGLSLVVFGAVVVTHGSAPGTFDGTPPAPLSYASGSYLDGWDVQVHSRDRQNWTTLEPVAAQHGADCSAPPATHVNTSYEGSVFQCKDHIMTAINASGYGEIVLTPPEMVDFSTQGTVSFDLSTLRMSTRDWVDVWITPYQDNLTLPFDNGDVDLQGVPRTGIHVIMSVFNGNTTWRAYTIQNFVETEISGCWWCELPGYLHYTPTGQQRETFKLTVSPSSFKFEMVPGGPNSGGVDAVTFIQNGIPNLGFTQGVVQFAHHSYTPTKDNSGVPATWHWDNIAISPSVPFTIDRALTRYVNGNGQRVDFATPAPANSYLRFSANGANITVNGQPARIQPAEKNLDRFRSYWMPIAEGTTSVTLAGTGTFNGPFFAQDFAIWSTGGTGPTATPTNTSVPPTATNTPLPPTPTNTAFPPTATPTATPTRTSTPATYRCQRRNANGTWTTVWTQAGGGTCP